MNQFIFNYGHGAQNNIWCHYRKIFDKMCFIVQIIYDLTHEPLVNIVRFSDGTTYRSIWNFFFKGRKSNKMTDILELSQREVDGFLVAGADIDFDAAITIEQCNGAFTAGGGLLGWLFGGPAGGGVGLGIGGGIGQAFCPAIVGWFNKPTK
jgi:hypothetical protein